MAKIYKTPGVYIQEQNAFPNSVVPVSTSITAFVGYTEKAKWGKKDLANVPTRISSYSEYLQYFGGGPKITYQLESMPNADPDFELHLEKKSQFFLYYGIRSFFANGGSSCYIVSIGNYTQEKKITDFFGAIKEEKGRRPIGIDTLLKEPEPSILVIPDAVLLPKEDCFRLQREMLKHCGQDMKSRIAILDVFDGFQGRKGEERDVIQEFRDGIGHQYLDFGAAYYPWLETTITSASEIDFMNISSSSHPVLQEMLINKVKQRVSNSQLKVKQGEEMITIIKEIPDIASLSAKSDSGDEVYKKVQKLQQQLLAISPYYKTMVGHLYKKINLLPPGAAMAGIYAMTDNQIGVHQAPANVSIGSVIQPAVSISNEEQEDLNVPISGKAVNAIRAFPGKGVLVWGARTLDGNSQDWRYINVRRTVIFIEQSIKYAAAAYVFEPNDANTWTSLKALITNFLTNLWKQGALAGAMPEDAFSVQVGLGSTMTPADILEGTMKINVLIAVSRPAEFIVISFQQKMQTA